MQLKTFLALFCTIIILFVQLNTAAPTTTKKPEVTTKKPVTTTTKAQKTSPTAKPILVGGHSPWDKNIKAKHKKFFDDYKKIILQKLQEIHKVPKSFNPKPEKFATQTVGGINYLYLVKLPTNQYAVISIHDRAWQKGHYGKAENVVIRPQTYELNDKNV